MDKDSRRETQYFVVTSVILMGALIAFCLLFALNFFGREIVNEYLGSILVFAFVDILAILFGIFVFKRLGAVLLLISIVAVVMSAVVGTGFLESVLVGGSILGLWLVPLGLAKVIRNTTLGLSFYESSRNFNY